jgi:hypothetical protein
MRDYQTARRIAGTEPRPEARGPNRLEAWGEASWSWQTTGIATQFINVFSGGPFQAALFNAHRAGAMRPAGFRLRLCLLAVPLRLVGSLAAPDWLRRCEKYGSAGLRCVWR